MGASPFAPCRNEGSASLTLHIRWEVCLSSSPWLGPRQGCLSACASAQYQASASQTAGILLSLVTSQTQMRRAAHPACRLLQHPAQTAGTNCPQCATPCLSFLFAMLLRDCLCMSGVALLLLALPPLGQGAAIMRRANGTWQLLPNRDSSRPLRGFLALAQSASTPESSTSRKAKCLTHLIEIGQETMDLN